MRTPDPKWGTETPNGDPDPIRIPRMDPKTPNEELRPQMGTPDPKWGTETPNEGLRPQMRSPDPK